MRKTVLISITLLNFTFLLVTSCTKVTETNNQILNSSNKGLFGKVLVYNEFGEKQSPLGVVITAHCTDRNSSDSILFDTIYKTSPDDFGIYSFKDCHRGTYTIVYTKNYIDSNKIIGFSHSSANGDTLNPIILAKPPIATIKILSAELSKNNLLLNIKRVINLTGSTSAEYGVVTRYFFSNTPTVSNTSYKYQWISGATFGKTGYTDTVIIQKSTEIFSSTSSGLDITKPIYFRAYLDNIHYYGFKNNINDKMMLFPNLTSPTDIFKIDSIAITE